MRIKVQFFSQLKEIAGRSELELGLSEGTTVAELLAEMYRRYPALQDWNGSLLIAVGVEFVARDYVLQPNDEIAIMPPVQGG
jgi:molybdopterin converting factor subunit 1